MHRLPRSTALTVLAAFAALALAACGGSDATPGPEDATAPTSDVPAGPQTRSLLLIEGSSLVVQDPDGTRRPIASIDPARGAPAFPVWSPDGQTVAFVVRAFFTGDPAPDWGDDVFAVSAAGDDLRQVRAHSTRGEQIVGLAWQPDSRRLLLGQFNTLLRDGLPVGVAGAAILEVDPDTSEEHIVLEGGYDPSLSSDGSRMAYVRLEQIAGDTTVMVANGDGTNPTVLITSAAFEVIRFPRIAPNGRTVAFAGAAPLVQSSDQSISDGLAALLGPLYPRPAQAHGTPMDIWLADTDTAEVTQLTAIAEDDPYPAWTPDSQAVIFIAANGLYEAAVDGTPLVRTGDGDLGGQLAVAPQ